MLRAKDLLLSKRFEIMEKLYSSKTCLKMAGGEDASLLDPPLPTRIIMSLSTTSTSRFGFSMICGKFCHSCVEITARTAFAQCGHFTSKQKVGSTKGGFRPPKTFWVRQWVHGLLLSQSWGYNSVTVENH